MLYVLNFFIHSIRLLFLSGPLFAPRREQPVLFGQEATRKLCVHQDRAGRPAAQGANLWVVLRCHWNNRKYGASKPRILQEKEFVRKSSGVLARALKQFHQPCPKP